MYTLCHSMLRSILLALALLIVIAAGLPAAGSAATTPAPHWTITSTASPSNLPPGDTSGQVIYLVTATNTGGAATDGSPITITDTLAPGITVHAVTAGNPHLQLTQENETITDCDPGPPVTCQLTKTLYPGERLVAFVPVDIGAGLDGTTVTNHVSVTGGGTPAATATEQTPVTADTRAPGFQSFDTSITDPAGNPVTQAGSHPYQFNLAFQLHTKFSPLGSPVASPRNIHAQLPRGLVVNPAATPVRCTEVQFETRHPDGTTDCPDASAVGLFQATIGLFGFANSAASATPLYNMVPPAGAPAEFATNAEDADIFLHLLGGVDTAGNYALSADAKDITQFGLVSGASVQLWGDPSASAHDFRRGNCGHGSHLSQSCPVDPTDTPFLTMPSACSGPLTASLGVDSWEDPGNPLSATAPTTDDAGNPVGVTGCDQLDFDPALTAQPDTTQADSPTGLDVDLQIPQTNSHDTLATANLKSTTVDLPAGMSVNPSSADGLAACSPAQIGLTTPLGTTPAHFSADPDTCPDSSKIGTVQITTPLLDDPLQGSVYLAQQDHNPFPNPSLLALYIAIKDPTTGIVIKLPGKVTPDPVTGQLRASFDDTPELPFSDFQLHFEGGNRATLVSPPSCGTYQTTAKLTPWSAADPDNPTLAETVTSTDSFDVTTGPGGGPCPDYTDPGRFTPTFDAGTVSPIAGTNSPFVLKITRPDGQQSLKKIAVTLPLGLTAKLAGIPRCAQSAIVPGVGGSTSCPAGSQVGTVTVSAGAGSSPFFLVDQPVYLTDGYDGAPFGLAIDTHALAGPFDLGHVVVRTKLSIDPITTQVSADAEPLPSIIQGIPLHIRSVTLKMDRDRFVLNPTSCAAQTVGGQITGGGANFADPADDSVKGVSSPFQVGGCSDLGLSPKLAIALTGKGQTTDDKHPGVHATVRQTAGQANLKRVVVSLPLSLALDPDNANGLCEFTDGSKVDPTCPKASIVGKAVARTPILDQPLTGPVYFVKNIRKDPKSGREIRTLPKLVIPLTGENGLRLNLVGTSNVVNDRLVTTFDNIPDAPVSDFTLDINGGKGGILVVSGTDICKATQVADQQIDGQNGKSADADVYLQTPACPLKIVSKKVGKTSVAIKVSGLGAGKVTVSGKGIKKTSKTIARSTVATITAKRTKGKPGKVKISFVAAGAKTATTTTLR